MRTRRPLSSQQARFAKLYVAGPDDMRGNGTRAYLAAYPTCHSENAAKTSASRLLRCDNVRVRLRELREIAAAECTARLRNWMELAPYAQETLRAAAAGELVFDQADPKLAPELLRLAVRSASEILDRALGTVKQMHENKVHGGIIVAVAGPSQMPTTKPGPFGNGHRGALPPA